MTKAHSVESATLVAGTTTGLMSVITQNATAISVICTAGFGLIYACCAIWNAYSNHKRNKVSKDAIYQDIIDGMIKDGAPVELIKQVSDRKSKI